MRRLYTLVSIMTEEEFHQHQNACRSGMPRPEPASEARDIVATLFGEGNSLGILRIREHRLFSPAAGYRTLSGSITCCLSASIDPRKR